MRRWLVMVLLLCGFFAGTLERAQATEYFGQVTYGGVPVPGATVTATQGSKAASVVTDQLNSRHLGSLQKPPRYVCLLRRIFGTGSSTIDPPFAGTDHFGGF